MSLFPTPSLNYFPKSYRDNPSDGITALSSALDYQINGLETEILQLAWLKQIEKCPSQFLDEFGYLFSAGLLNSDSDRTKRQKIKSAIMTQKRRGSWVDNAKPVIDAITGYSSAIFNTGDQDDWILTGDGVIEGSTDWAILGGNGTAPYGMSLIGLGSEVEIPGNIYINLHQGIYIAVLTAEQIYQIVVNIKTDIVPAYMIIYLGYVDSTGIFQVYSGGILNG